MKDTRQDTVMIVDDTPANLNLLTDILKSQGYRVAAFPAGEDALKAASKRPPDLILLDFKMPEMDGYEVCKRIRQKDILADTPIIFISALNEPEDKVKAFSLGGVDYITKPFNDQEVQARVATHIRLRHLNRQLQTQNQQLEQLVENKVREIAESQLATIHALSELVESRDVETGGHIERTRLYCKFLALEMKESPRFFGKVGSSFVDNIYQASPLHDIGKFGVPDRILLKKGKLNRQEFDEIKSHVTIGHQTLIKARKKYPNNSFLNMGIEIARWHHEKWDGTGYPDGLSGTQIPLSARVMAIADVYDALRSKRPYKPAFTHEQSVEIIRDGSGTHFDPDIVALFEKIEKKFAVIHNRQKNSQEEDSI